MTSESGLSAHSDVLSRRSLVKLLAMATCSLPAIRGEAVAETLTKRIGPVPSRPRLFYNASSLEHLKKAFRDDTAAEVELRKRGDDLLAASFIPESAAEVGGGQQANYNASANQIADMGLTLGLLFHLTGESRYADKLRDALLYYTGYVRWAGPGLKDRFPPWHSELDTGRFCFGYAAGYDALRHTLSETDRKAIVEGMLRLGGLPILNDWVLPGKRIHSLDSMGHNWWGVCVAGGGLCALTLLGDDPRAQEWIDAVDAGFAQWFDYRGNVPQNRMPTFERSGPSYESVAYTNYGVSEYLRYRLAWQNVFAGKQAAHMLPLDHVATYFLHTLYPTSNGFYSVNFNDGYLEVDVTETVLLLVACGLGSSDGARYLEEVHTDPHGTLLTLLRHHAGPHASTSVPCSQIYPEMGWAMMRSSWDADSTLLAMKSGYTWNHAHADAGSFIVFQRGRPLIIDSGNCAYSRPEYTEYYCQSRAHNVILFDGQGQPADDIHLGCKFPGRMHSLIDGLDLKYVYADATGPMARWFRRSYRHWLWSDDVILVIDTVLAYDVGKLDWLLHYAGDATVVSDASVLLKDGPAEALVTMLYPPASHRQEIGLAEHHPDTKIPYFVFSPANAAKSQQFFTAICLRPEDPPRFELLKGTDYLGVRVVTAKTIEETYLNLRSVGGSTGTAIVMDGWTTDANMIHLRRPATPGAEIDRYFVGEGSYLRRENHSLLESLSKLTTCWSPGDPLDIFSNDGSAAILVSAKRVPRQVRWNGREISGSYCPQTELLSLTTRPNP